MPYQSKYLSGAGSSRRDEAAIDKLRQQIIKYTAASKLAKEKSIREAAVRRMDRRHELTDAEKIAAAATDLRRELFKFGQENDPVLQKVYNEAVNDQRWKAAVLKPPAEPVRVPSIRAVTSSVSISEPYASSRAGIRRRAVMSSRELQNLTEFGTTSPTRRTAYIPTYPKPSLGIQVTDHTRHLPGWGTVRRSPLPGTTAYVNQEYQRQVGARHFQARNAMESQVKQRLGATSSLAELDRFTNELRESIDTMYERKQIDHMDLGYLNGVLTALSTKNAARLIGSLRR